MFRTADGAGVSKLYLAGYTPTPVDELGKVRREVQKTALGAEWFVPWEKVTSISALARKFKKEKVKLVALEYTKDAKQYKNFNARGALALLVGNEVRGLSRAVLQHCDDVIKIPMHGRKKSLNVSVAFAVAVYQIITLNTTLR